MQNSWIVGHSYDKPQRKYKKENQQQIVVGESFKSRLKNC